VGQITSWVRGFVGPKNIHVGSWVPFARGSVGSWVRGFVGPKKSRGFVGPKNHGGSWVHKITWARRSKKSRGSKKYSRGFVGPFCSWVPFARGSVGSWIPKNHVGSWVPLLVGPKIVSKCLVCPYVCDL